MKLETLIIVLAALHGLVDEARSQVSTQKYSEERSPDVDIGGAPHGEFYATRGFRAACEGGSTSSS